MEGSDHKPLLDQSSGDFMVKIFDALSHPMRVKIMGILSVRRQYISELARTVYELSKSVTISKPA